MYINKTNSVVPNLLEVHRVEMKIHGSIYTKFLFFQNGNICEATSSVLPLNAL
jgi:hypothetical protein